MIDEIERLINVSEFVAENERWPIIRTGEREPICDLVRWLVWQRDGGRCKFCGRNDWTELDHVVPWSAGGPDDSTNLRVLCRGCNQRRSNRRLIEWPRLVPVVRACGDCSADPDLWDGMHKRQLDLVGYHFCPTCDSWPELDDEPPQPAFCGACLTISTAHPARLL